MFVRKNATERSEIDRFKIYKPINFPDDIKYIITYPFDSDGYLYCGYDKKWNRIECDKNIRAKYKIIRNIYEFKCIFLDDGSVDSSKYDVYMLKGIEMNKEKQKEIFNDLVNSEYYTSTILEHIYLGNKYEYTTPIYDQTGGIFMVHDISDKDKIVDIFTIDKSEIEKFKVYRPINFSDNAQYFATIYPFNYKNLCDAYDKEGNKIECKKDIQARYEIFTSKVFTGENKLISIFLDDGNIDLSKYNVNITREIKEGKEEILNDLANSVYWSGALHYCIYVGKKYEYLMPISEGRKKLYVAFELRDDKKEPNKEIFE